MCGVREYDGAHNKDIDDNQEKPTVTCRLLDKLNSCIDEQRVFDSIDRLNREIGKIESTSGPSKRTLQMRHEVERLESLLNYSQQHSGLPRTGYSATSDQSEG